jgi:Uma2 family endonuclease
MQRPITDISLLDLSKTYSYADYLTWQFDEMVELIKGKVQRMSPAPLRLHQKVSQNLNLELSLFFKKHLCDIYVAPFDVRLYKTEKVDKKVLTVIQPDISIICDKSKLDEKGCLGSPDLIVEIISKSSKKRDYHDKYDLYEENNVLEYWIADPDAKTIDVFKLENGAYITAGNYYERTDIVQSEIFPDLRINWTDIFTE